MVAFPPLTLFTDHWTAVVVPSDNTAVKTLVVPARTLVAPCTVMVSAGREGAGVGLTAGAGEAAPDPPHPASAAANKRIAAKQHHARNRFWGKPARPTKGSRGPGFKQPYFLSPGETLNTNILIQSCGGRMYQVKTWTEVRSFDFLGCLVGADSTDPAAD